jgi:hypothetical protein
MFVIALLSNCRVGGDWLEMAFHSDRLRAMRVQVAVNDGRPVRASLTSKGSLAVRVNLSNDGAEYSHGSLWIQAMDFNDEQSFVNSVWEVADLRVGDKVEVKVLDDGESDPPTKVERSKVR